MKRIWHLAHPYGGTERMIVFAATEEEMQMLSPTIEPNLYCEAISDSFTDAVVYAGKCGFDMSNPNHKVIKQMVSYGDVRRRLNQLSNI